MTRVRLRFNYDEDDEVVITGLLHISRGNLTRLRHCVRRAIAEAGNVYAFRPDSYSNGLHSALLGIQQTLDAAFGPDDFNIAGDDHGS